MQTVINYSEPTSTTEHRPVFTVRLEVVAYLCVAGLALVLYFAALGAVPLSAPEAREALAAWRAVTPDAPGEPIIPQSPLLFFLQSLSFSTLGADEASARGITALAGVLLVLSPLLFRRLLGATRAFLLSLLLLCSPVLMITARSSSPVVWSLLLAVLALWMYWRARESGNAVYAVGAVVAAAALVFLSEPGGVVLALILVGAGVLTFLTSPTDDDDEIEQSQAGNGFLGLRNVPWAIAGLVAGLVVLLVSTGLMLHPAGLSAVGEVFGGFVRGFTQTPEVAFLPALIALFYEPFILVFALVGLLLLVRSDMLTALDRFLTAWAVLGVFAALVFGGARSDHALWITVPLTGLASHTFVRLLANNKEDTLFPVPGWARWIVALAMIALLCLFALSFQTSARALMNSIDEQPPNIEAASTVLLVLSVMFVIVGYFMIASLWDSRTAFRGIGLGALIFGAVTSLGSGWNTAVAQADNPARFWRMEATSPEALLLRETLIDISEREGGGFTYFLPVHALAPQDSVIAWVLRDFKETTFITQPQEAATQMVALLPYTPENLPDLSGPYVGQDFITSRRWDVGTLRPVDFLAWWGQTEVRVPFVSTEAVALWLRQDIYDGAAPTSGVVG